MRLAVIALLVSCCGFGYGQSTEQAFPSPVTASEISATIRARDLGDARLTTHFWLFDSTQGDIFINVSTQNFSGDIDIYEPVSLKPLTKMVMFADSGLSETGRVLYMRQPGRLLLRVEGRSPNDDPATYRIKFAGSFVALAPEKASNPPTVESAEATGIHVNSAGTIVSVTPKKAPVRAQIPPAVPVKRTPKADSQSKASTDKNKPARSGGPGVATGLGHDSTATPTEDAGSSRSTPAKPATNTSTRPQRPSRETPSDPMTGIRLVITFKGGHVVEKSMTTVTRFSYESGFLTVYAKDGSIARYAMSDVSSVVVQ